MIKSRCSPITNVISPKMYFHVDLLKRNLNQQIKFLLNLNLQTPFYACVCTTDCVPCLPLYGIQGGNTNGRVTQTFDGNALKKPCNLQGFFLSLHQHRNKADVVEIFFGLLIQIVA
jgi:hypothetical protein